VQSALRVEGGAGGVKSKRTGADSPCPACGGNLVEDAATMRRAQYCPAALDLRFNGAASRSQLTSSRP
jgi:hypothetical protein